MEYFTRGGSNDYYWLYRRHISHDRWDKEHIEYKIYVKGLERLKWLQELMVIEPKTIYCSVKSFENKLLN